MLRGRGVRLGRDDEEELVELDAAYGGVAVRDRAEPTPLAEVCGDTPGDVCLVRSESGRLGQTRERELHVVSRAPVRRHRDPERRLGEDQAGRAGGVRRSGRVLEL